MAENEFGPDPDDAESRLSRALALIASYVRVRRDQFHVVVDAELIVPFQKYVYYPIISVFTLYLVFFADGAPQYVDRTLGDSAYWCWLALGSAFPALSLFGRHLYDISLKAAEGEPNSAYGGARLMLAGDFGVWMAIIIYLGCVFGAAWWGEAVWGIAFVVMGIPGGGIFTYRSLRRMRQIKDRLP